MAQLQLKRDVFNKARDRSILKPEDVEAVKLLEGDGKRGVSAPVQDFPLGLLRALLDDTRLTANQRAVIAMQIYGMNKSEVNAQSVYCTVVGSPVEFGSTFALLGGRAANCEIFLNGRWYPVSLGIEFLDDNHNHARTIFLHTTLTMCETSFHIGHHIGIDLFVDELGNRCDRTVNDVLNQFGYRPLSVNPGEFNLKLVRSERSARDHGKQVMVKAPVLADSHGYWSAKFITRALGTPDAPRKAIVEAELEVDEDARSYYTPYGHTEQAQSRLPFVRIFSLDLKTYVYVDVDDIVDYAYDHDAMQRLHLPEEMLSVLTRVFNTPVERLFGDLIHGKHGGVVILAAGNPGVGKTLTAEVYAEHTERPLYVLELGELGTNAEDVEQNLRQVFARVARWNAVLQFDECEIFLTQRGDDLERSAIVGIFLRLLDYYRGILFLTTNRSEVLDHAVLSRVMLNLKYPDLDAVAREVIWTSMLKAARLELDNGTIAELAETEINGRQIRNLTRLARILYPDGRLTLAQMRDVLHYGGME